MNLQFHAQEPLGAHSGDQLINCSAAATMVAEPANDFLALPHARWDLRNSDATTPPACVTAAALVVFLSEANSTLSSLDLGPDREFGVKNRTALVQILHMLTTVRV